LGYVGLPLAVQFGKHGPTVGYDLSRKKIDNIQRRVDTTGELSAAELKGGVVPACYPGCGRA
jgi:UDP-N-acetyl-D-galactosamine dehydrogenase